MLVLSSPPLLTYCCRNSGGSVDHRQSLSVHLEPLSLHHYAVSLNVSSHPAHCSLDISEEFWRGQAGRLFLSQERINRCTYQQLGVCESDPVLFSSGSCK